MDQDPRRHMPTTPVEPKPSPVVFIRNVPSDISDAEIHGLCGPFGRPVKILTLRHKGQAFVELEDVEQSSALLSHFSSTSISIRGHILSFHFGNRDTIAPKDADQRTPSARRVVATPSAPDGTGTEVPSPIILVAVHNAVYPITVDVLTQVFSRFGHILKIVIFMKAGVPHAFVQFATLASAVTAQQALDGLDIYANCCTLRIRYSSLPDLHVRANTETSRDFLRPHLPQQPHGASQVQLVLHHPHPPPHHIVPPSSQFARAPPQSWQLQQLQQLQQQQQQNPDDLEFDQQHLDQFDHQRSRSHSHSPDSQSHQHQQHQHPHQHQHQQPQQFSEGEFDHDAQGRTFNRPRPLMAQAQAFPPYAPTSPTGAAMATSSTGAPQTEGSVLIVSNLPERILPDHLFNLFGFYGDIVRVKKMYSKPDTAFVQYYSPFQAQQAVAYLHGCRLLDHSIKVNVSHHLSISMPKPDSGDGGEMSLTKDYSTSKLHRYKSPGSRNAQYICAPSSLLHLATLPPDVTEESLHKLFSVYGPVVAVTVFVMNQKRMAHVQMASVEGAVAALTFLHLTTLSGQVLRVSFSKAPSPSASGSPTGAEQPSHDQAR